MAWVVCPRCQGAGICIACGGVPIKRSVDPTDPGWICTACKKTGICQLCMGSGSIWMSDPSPAGGGTVGSDPEPTPPPKVISIE